MSSAELRPPRESPGLVFKMEEIWKPVKGYEGCYEISNFGRVKSLYREIHRRIEMVIISSAYISKGSDKRPSDYID